MRARRARGWEGARLCRYSPPCADVAVLFQKQHLRRPAVGIFPPVRQPRGSGAPASSIGFPKNCKEIISFRAFTSPASVAFRRRFFPFDTVILPAGIEPLRRRRFKKKPSPPT